VKADPLPDAERIGVLVTWNDARGFGFIRPDPIAPGVKGSDIFVHVAAFGRGAERPASGARISYRMGRGRDGRPIAARARLAEPTRPAAIGHLSALHLRPREARIAASGALALLALLAVAAGDMPVEFLGPYIGMGLMAMVLYGSDKVNARADRWRVPETTLHATDLIFGIIGGLLAQGLYGHKTAKQGYRAITWAIAAGHAVLLISAGFGVRIASVIAELKTLAGAVGLGS
jgi:uncharacterized membrane protein YsdA (DUF1294 family)/cold shock CspA family protein